MNFFSQKLLRAIAQVFPEAIFYQETPEKILALTIDDVGDPKLTQPIVEAIAKYNQRFSTPENRVRATFFFITDYLGDSNQILDEILRQGHEIGNHGQYDRTHADLPEGEFIRELVQAHRRLTAGTDASIAWFRPGRGRYRKEWLPYLSRIGYNRKLALASMLPLDTFPFIGEPQLTSSYLSNFIFPGSILVLHGGSEKNGTGQRTQNTVAVLKQLLPKLREQGYRGVTLTELTTPPDTRKNNNEQF